MSNSKHPCRIIHYASQTPSGEDGINEGKFLQFIWQGVDYLLFADRGNHRFHNQILGRFLDEHQIPNRWVDDQTLEIDDDRLEVIGGGRFRLDHKENRLELWDNSTAYGRFDEAGIEGRITSADHPWRNMQIVVS
ncbi:MAG: hypothetical protein R6X15_05160 [Pseudomonadota bacterium]